MRTAAHLLLHEVKGRRQRRGAVRSHRHELYAAEQHGQSGCAASVEIAQRDEEGGERDEALDTSHRLEPACATTFLLLIRAWCSEPTRYVCPGPWHDDDEAA